MLKLSDFFNAILPFLAAIIINVFFVKSNFLHFLNKPIDAKLLWFDNLPLIGEHKTWKGFLGMPFFSAFILFLLERFSLLRNNDMVNYELCSQSYLIESGLIIGFCISIFQIPTSFIKRRLGIQPGKSKTGFSNFMFSILDHIDIISGLVFGFYLTFHINVTLIGYVILYGSVLHVFLKFFFKKMKLLTV